jgi:hypothetical protein
VGAWTVTSIGRLVVVVTGMVVVIAPVVLVMASVVLVTGGTVDGGEAVVVVSAPPLHAETTSTAPRGQASLVRIRRR